MKEQPRNKKTRFIYIFVARTIEPKHKFNIKMIIHNEKYGIEAFEPYVSNGYRARVVAYFFLLQIYVVSLFSLLNES